LLFSANWANATVAYTIKIQNTSSDENVMGLMVASKEEMQHRKTSLDLLIQQTDCVIDRFKMIDKCLLSFENAFDDSDFYANKIFLRIKNTAKTILHWLDCIRSSGRQYGDLQKDIMAGESAEGGFTSSDMSPPVSVPASPLAVAETALDVSIYSAESITIKAADDFRILVPPYIVSSFHVITAMMLRMFCSVNLSPRAWSEFHGTSTFLVVLSGLPSENDSQMEHFL